MKVLKFGGTSLANADQFRKVAAIIKADPKGLFVVVSAPGKRTPDDEKITDLLDLLHKGDSARLPSTLLMLVFARFQDIINELGLTDDLCLQDEFTELKLKVAEGNVSRDYLLSRGEYFSARIMACLLQYSFVDSKDIICFSSLGRFDEKATNQRASDNGFKRIKGVVIPGFYGSLPNGEIKTFSRGGSDITGAIVAQLVNADVYENWTDVDGVRMTDPKVVSNARKIETITYRELRELAYMGASVLHDEAIFPVRKASIPINIRNTNNPTDEGTWIVANEAKASHPSGSIVGIAARKNFTVITIEKSMMNTQVGFVRRICTAFEHHQVSFEHMPSGIDTISIIVSDKNIEGKLPQVLEHIRLLCEPDSINVVHGMAMICTVGHSMAHALGVSAKLFTAVADARINVWMINQGASEISIIIGVTNDDCDKAVQAIYTAFTSQE